MGNGQHPHGQPTSASTGSGSSLPLPYQPQTSASTSQYNPQSDGIASGLRLDQFERRFVMKGWCLDRSWSDRASGGSLFFPQASSSANSASSTYHPADSFGFLATATAPGAGLANYSHTSTTSAPEYAGQTHHLTAGLSESTWNSAMKPGTAAATNSGSEMGGWAPAAAGSFNSFDNYSGLTNEMFMGHHHHQAASASFSYGHHNSGMVGMSPAAAAVAYRNYNLAKNGGSAAAPFGFY